MLYLYFGKDTYTSKKELNKIIKKHIEENQEINFSSIDASNISDFQDIILEINTIPFLAEKKLIVVNNFLSQNKKSALKTEYTETLKKLKIEKAEEIILIHYENTSEVDKRQTLFKYIKKSGELINFELPTGEKAKGWIENILKAKKLSIDSDAIESILNNDENIEYWNLISNLHKLTLFAKANNKDNISLNMVETVVTRGITAEIFDLTDKIARKKKKESLIILKKLLELGENEFMLMGTLTYQIRTLLNIKLLQEKGLDNSSIIKISKLHPFVVNKNKKQTEQFTVEQLIDLLKYIAEIF